MVLLIGMSVSAQYEWREPQGFTIGYSFDPSMAFFGEHDYKHIHNPEIKFGFFTDNIKFMSSYEFNRELGFEKWTYLSVDYKWINDWPYNIKLDWYAGVEIMGITRKSFDYSAEGAYLSI